MFRISVAQRSRRSRRHRNVKRLSPTLALGLAGLLVVGCSSSSGGLSYLPASESSARVTGFASFSLAGGTSTDPLTIHIGRANAGRLAQLARQLPAVEQSQVHCQEGLELIYRIVFQTEPTVVVDGYRCDAAVTVSLGGKHPAWRKDADCSLFHAVRHVLHAQAKATEALDIGCADS
jgi:hypothetical protein